MKYYKNILSIVLMSILAVFSSYGMQQGELTIEGFLEAKASGQIVEQLAPRGSDKIQSLSQRIKNLSLAPMPIEEKKQILQDLRQELIATKPKETKENTALRPKKPSLFKEALHKWLKADILLKITETSLAKKPVSLPIVPIIKLQHDLDDLSKSSILTEAGMPEPAIEDEYAAFKSIAQRLILQLDGLKGPQQPTIQSKFDLINELNKMSTFIYDYDLNPKEKNALHESERCWLLELIKNTILNNNTFTPAMINDWKEQIQNIVIVTDKSIKAKKSGTPFQGSVIELDALQQQEKKAKELAITTAPTTLSENDLKLKNNLKNTLLQLEAQMKSDIYNTKLLSDYLNALKQYKKLLLPVDLVEIKRISKLIRITANKIKRLTVIAPRTKTLTEQITKRLHEINTNLNKPESLQFTNLIKPIPGLMYYAVQASTDLEEYLAVEPYYDASKVITDTTSDLYRDIITTLERSIITFNNLAITQKQGDTITINHFRELAYEIEKLEYLLTSDPNNQQIKNMINSYKDRIQKDTNDLMEKTGFFAGLHPDAIKKWINNAFAGEYLKPYKEQILESMIAQEKELDRIKKENEEKIKHSIAEAQKKQQEIEKAIKVQQSNLRRPGFQEQPQSIIRDVPLPAKILTAQPQQDPTLPPAAQPQEPPYEIMEGFGAIGKGIAYVAQTIVSTIGKVWNWIRPWLPW